MHAKNIPDNGVVRVSHSSYRFEARNARNATQLDTWKT